MSAQIPCRCRGEIKNCLYCHGRGYLDEVIEPQADQLIEQTRVVHCPACGLQNRIKDSAVAVGEIPRCYGCQAELFNPSISPFDRPPFRRKERK